MQNNKIICNPELSVLKLLKRISNIVVWTVLGLYLILFLLTNMTAVQEYMGRKAASYLSQKLGTKVSIESMSIGLLNHVTLDGVHIKDQQGRDMLYGGRLSARMEILPMLEGQIALAKVQVFNTHARLYQRTPDDPMNCQFIIDALASKDTTDTAPLDLRINSLIVRHTSVSYDCLDAQETPRKLNPRHLWLKDISAHILLKALTDDSLNVNVKRLSFKEQSGLQLNRLSFRFEGDRSHSLLQDLILRMPGTDIQLGDIQATYRFRGDHFVTPALQYKGSIKPSTITPADLACLVPALHSFRDTLSLSAAFDGQGETLNIPQLSIHSTTGGLALDMTGTIKNLRQKEPSWLADIKELEVNAKTIDFLSENLKGEDIEVPEILNRMGNIQLTGKTTGKGFLTSMTAQHVLATEAGQLTLDMTMNEHQRFTGHVRAEDMDMKRLLDNNHLGKLATEIELKGEWSKKGSPTIEANGLVSTFEWNGYPYHDIKIDGIYKNNGLTGSVSINDPNVAMEINGALERNGHMNNILLAANVNNLSPLQLKLTDKWNDALFSGVLEANFQASNLNDAVGSINISQLALSSPAERYTLEQLHVESNFTEDTHHITIDSDFGTVELTGDFDYETLPQSLINFIAAKLPTLPGIPKVDHRTTNNFVISANIEKSDWLEHLLQVPLRLQKPVILQGMVNDAMHNIELECEAPRFSYDGAEYTYGRAFISSPGDSLQYNISVTKIKEDSTHLDLKVVGNVVNNNLFTAFIFDDHGEKPINGQLNATVSFGFMPNEKQTAFISIEPSIMSINHQQWDIEPSFISYSKNHVNISNFTIHNDQQFLTVNGIASDNPQDTLAIRMREMEIAYILELVDFHAVEFDGYATGGGTLRGVFGNLEADAKLKVNEFKFEHGRMGTLDASVVWKREQEQINITAIADDGPDAMTYIDGYVSPKHNFIDLDIRAEGTHLDFARSFTSSFLSSVEGHGNGAVRLAGPLDAINLTGELTLNGRVHVTTLGTDYELRNDTLRMTPNEITFVNCTIYDVNNHTGILTGGIHHQELTNMTYDIYVQAQELLAYDFNDFGDDTFYGTVYANGNVAIHGRDEGVVIEADVTPLQNSVFVYNAASPDAVSDQEFIEWNSASPTTFTGQPTPTSSPDEDDFRTDLTLKLKINATPQATIRLLMDPRTSDYITLRGAGELQTTYYNKGGFEMFGTYRVTEGNYGLTIQNIIRKNFVFQEGGTIVFGGDPYDALLNLQAINTVNGVSLSDLNVGRSFSSTVRVNCLMNISGQPRAPIIDFDLDIPNVNTDEKQMVRSIINGQEEMNQQVIYLLAVGRFYPQGANNATDNQQGPSKTSLAMQSLLSGTLSGQINNMLGRVIKSNNWNFGANISTGDEGWNNAEYEGLISGRLLNNRLLVNGQFGYRDNATTANPSFIGDFDIRYLLFPNGNLALKVYNQTNERYFTKSTLNTQGIGIIMKKDFDSINDLFGINRRTKKTKKVK